MQRIYDYYTPELLQHIAFYSIPQTLFLDKEFSALSTHAKLLYGLLLDRLKVSIKNGWIDKDNHAYISMKLKTVSKMIECSEKKCSQLLTQLEEIGLIKCIVQGLFRPTRIYVMNCNAVSIASQNGKYNYYLLEETQKFPYYPIPKALFTDTRYLPLSTYAKILYGFLLDCVSLSCEHQWIDKENHTYIYFTSKEAENLLHCSERKVSSLFSELKKAGLIQRKIQGQNKPARIYVMNFIKKISLAKDTPLVKACRKFKSMDMQVLPSGHAKITN